MQEQEEDLREAEQSRKHSFSLDMDLSNRLKVEKKKFNLLDVQINQAEQDIFELEKQNEELMMQYDEIFGKGSS